MTQQWFHMINSVFSSRTPRPLSPWKEHSSVNAVILFRLLSLEPQGNKRVHCLICCRSTGAHADSRLGSGVGFKDVRRDRFLRERVGRVTGRWWTAAQHLPWQLTSRPPARLQFWGWPWNMLGPRAWHREEENQSRNSSFPRTIGPEAVWAVKERVTVSARSHRATEPGTHYRKPQDRWLKEAFEMASDN